MIQNVALQDSENAADQSSSPTATSSFKSYDADNDDDNGMTTVSSSIVNDDEVLRKLLKPSPTRKDVMNILVQYYYSDDDDNVDTNNYPRIVRQLDSYDDCNYQVMIRKETFLLKITNGVESKDFIQHHTNESSSSSIIQLQHTIMHTLHTNGICTTVPVKPVRYPTTNYNTTASSSSSPYVLLLNLPVVSQQQQEEDEESDVVVSSSSSSSAYPLLAVRLYTWVHGQPMSTVPYHQLSLHTFVHVGQQLGYIDHILDTIPTKMTSSSSSTTGSNTNSENTQQLLLPQHRYHQWDTKNTYDLLPYAARYIRDNHKPPQLQQQRRRNMIVSILETFRTEILLQQQEQGKTEEPANQQQQQQEEERSSSFFRTGLIMGDYNDANIILRQQQPQQPHVPLSPPHQHSTTSTTTNTSAAYQFAGIIDFGDSLESWRVLDITIAMAYAMLTTYGKGNRSSISAMAAVLRGYNSVYPLTDHERDHLVLLIVCRLACSVTLGAFSIAQNPHNAHYLSLHSEPAWNAIELLWGYDIEYRHRMKNVLDQTFNQACSITNNSDNSNDTTIASSSSTGAISTTGEILTIYDLAFPDPSVVDPFVSIRKSKETHQPTAAAKKT